MPAYDGLGSHDQEATLPGQPEPEREDPEDFIVAIFSREAVNEETNLSY